MLARHFFLILFALLGCVASAQVTLNQVDTFQDGTTMNWSGGSMPTNIATGGPAGAGDRYLQISSSGFNLATFNLVQWSGNYVAAGVTRVEADLRNTGPNPLVIRLVLFSNLGDRWSSNTSFTLAPGSAWTHVSFNMGATDFTHTLGTGTFNDVITNMQRLMFRHEPVITSGGTSVVGELGIDNVAARAATVTLFPTAYTITSGFLTSGTAANMGASDNSYLVIRQNPFRARQDPAVQIETPTTAPAGTFASFEFTLETSTTAVPAPTVTQRIELFNYNTNGWVTVDSRAASAADQTVNVTVSTNAMHFIHPTSREMKARLSYFDPGTLSTRAWGVNFDMVRWVLTP